MEIVIVTPAATGVRNGNRNTAQRWACFLRQMGHRVRVQVAWDGKQADLMLALHARRSHASIKHFSVLYPDLPLIVVLTGTDLYRDIQNNLNAQESLKLASCLVVLQEAGLTELSPELQAKTHVIYQSAHKSKFVSPSRKRFDICVIGNLREEKDPFRCALATALLPADSRIHLNHIGRALDNGLMQMAQALMLQNPRYCWLGELPHWRVQGKLARSRLMVISSIMEGGANVISEALAADVPVIASKVPGNIGMLGSDYAGYYPYGDERALAEMLYRAETDSEFYGLLKMQCARRKPLVQPERECAELNQMIVAASL